MKTRQSLVSNSSTSSFIIHYRDVMKIYNEKKTGLLTRKQINLLKKNGYSLSTITCPSDFDTMYLIKTSDEAEKELSLTYAKLVSCNQDDEVYFLVTNKIPFIASIHRGDETWIYPKNSKDIYVFRNLGNKVETYHQGDTTKELNKFVVDSLFSNPVVTRIPVKEYIKGEEKFQKEYKEDED